MLGERAPGEVSESQVCEETGCAPHGGHSHPSLRVGQGYAGSYHMQTREAGLLVLLQEEDPELCRKHLDFIGDDRCWLDFRVCPSEEGLSVCSLGCPLPCQLLGLQLSP